MGLLFRDGISNLIDERQQRAHRRALPLVDRGAVWTLAVQSIVVLAHRHIGQIRIRFDLGEDGVGDDTEDVRVRQARFVILDYDVLTAHWLSTVDPYENGDVTGDGFVALEDFHRFKTEYYTGPPGLLELPPGIPEPCTLALLLALSAGALFKSRRTR